MSPIGWYLAIGVIFACFVLLQERRDELADAVGELLRELFIVFMLVCAYPLVIAGRIYNLYKRKKGKRNASSNQ